MSLAAVLVRLGIDASDVEKQLAQIEKRFAAFEKVGKNVSDVGESMSLGLTVPLMAAGGAALLAATNVESAMATIRAGTGATGESLEALGEDFRAVFKRVPQNSQEVSTAIADLNKRLGITGQPLRELSEQMLELADLTGGKVAPLIASTTRVFGDWGVATDKQAGTLDLLWKTSQSTGIAVGTLADSLVQFGAPLRQMGFSLDESAALMGKWEKEGVNMELVLGSMRIAMGEFAREGIPMRKGLDDTMKKIRELGPGAEATSLAMQVFGARAGPDMAAAILEGRFEVEALLKQLQDSPETIMKAGAETETFGEKLAVLQNNATLAFEPIGVKLLGALENILPHLMTVIDRVAALATWFGNLPSGTQTAILGFVAFLAALGPVLIVVGKVITLVGGTIATFAKFKLFLLGTATKVGFLVTAAKGLAVAIGVVKAAFLILTGPIGLVIAAVAALVAGVVLLVRNWGTVSSFFAQLWASVLTTFSAAGTSLRAIVQGAWDFVVQGFTNLVSRVRSILTGVTDAITAPFRAAQERVAGITNAIGGFLQRINPFARSSPSLVDNVRMGVRAIQSEYSKLEQLQLPSLAAVQGSAPAAYPFAAAGGSPAVATAPAAAQGPLFTVQGMTVRSDNDIDTISRQLYRHIQTGMRARGGR